MMKKAKETKYNYQANPGNGSFVAAVAGKEEMSALPEFPIRIEGQVYTVWFCDQFGIIKVARKPDKERFWILLPSPLGYTCRLTGDLFLNIQLFSGPTLEENAGVLEVRVVRVDPFNDAPISMYKRAAPLNPPQLIQVAFDIYDV